MAWPSRSICFDVVPDATRLWKPEMAPHAMVMNSAGNRKPLVATLLSPTSAVNPVNAGMSRFETWPVMPAPTMPMSDRTIMP